MPGHGVTVVFVTLPNTKLELLEPLGEASPIRSFLDRNPGGGLHHVCCSRSTISPKRATGCSPRARACSATDVQGSAPMACQFCFFTRKISTAP